MSDGRRWRLQEALSPPCPPAPLPLCLPASLLTHAPSTLDSNRPHLLLPQSLPDQLVPTQEGVAPQTIATTVQLYSEISSHSGCLNDNDLVRVLQPVGPAGWIRSRTVTACDGQDWGSLRVEEGGAAVQRGPWCRRMVVELLTQACAFCSRMEQGESVLDRRRRRPYC